MFDVEEQIDAIIEKNDEYLEAFIDYLVESGLKNKTINKHLGNVSFYLNDYLARYEQEEMEKGTYFEYLDEFFGDFFVRKCMWSTPKTIKENITSLNKFYKCMLEKENISLDSYNNYKTITKEYKETWVEYCRDYNDPSVDMFFY